MTGTAVAQVLAAWRLDGAAATLIAERENRVFRVDHDTGSFALRLHRPGYQPTQMIRAELAWMTHLRASGLRVPAPVQTRDGAFLANIDGQTASMLTWMTGTPLGATGVPLSLQDRCRTFRQIGAVLAQIHAVSDDWDPPTGFARPHWDLDGLLGDAPLWGRFWDNPGLSGTDRAFVLTVRDRLRTDLATAELDFGLIHADMLRENIMVDTGELGIIDFDDSGYGYRLFDVATSLFKNRSEPDYDALEEAFIHGYREVRDLDLTYLEHFMTIRALSYLGWIIPRMNEPGAATRQQRFLQNAMELVHLFSKSVPLG